MPKIARKKPAAKAGKVTDSNDFYREFAKNFNLSFKVSCEYDIQGRHREMLSKALDATTKMLVVDGPAGTGKTFLAVLAALTKLSKKEGDQIVYIRSLAESASKGIGALPGEVDEKFKPWSMPLIEKLNEITDKDTINKLFSEHYIHCIPVNFVRGLTFKDSVVIIDEAQNLTYNELKTILTRFGVRSQYFVVGDFTQSDINGKSGFKHIYNAFNNEESKLNNFYTIQFTKEDIVRSEELEFIVGQLEKVEKTMKKD
tara:strand:+ start:18069 stop:18839 length:771 start_codon:yes stop_codon:yes gene_type:complete